MKNLAGKYAIVTGAGKGIGASVVERFLEEEAAGVAILEWDLALAEKTAKELDPTGKKVIAIKCDVSNSDQVKAAVDTVVAAFGRIDILVNNAGITRDRIFHKMTDDEWHAVININLNGVYNLCKYVVPMMREQQSGSIVNLSSVSLQGNAGQANYASAKAGMIGLTKSLAKEFSTRNITVNVVAPGSISNADFKDASKNIDLLSHIPAGRQGRPEEIASLVAFLSAPEAGYITGSMITADGGWTCGFMRNW